MVFQFWSWDMRQLKIIKGWFKNFPKRRNRTFAERKTFYSTLIKTLKQFASHPIRRDKLRQCLSSWIIRKVKKPANIFFSSIFRFRYEEKEYCTCSVKSNWISPQISNKTCLSRDVRGMGRLLMTSRLLERKSRILWQQY